MTRRTSEQGPAPWAGRLVFVAAAGALAVLFFAYTGRSPFATALVLDSEYYWQIALEVGEHGRPFPVPVFTACGYPLFLSGLVALAGPHPSVVYGVQLVLVLASGLLAYILARRLFSDTAAVVASALVLFYGPLAFYAVKILPETLAVSVLLLFLVIYDHARVRARFWQSVRLLVPAGAGAAACILVRGQYILVVGVLGLGLACHGTGLKRAWRPAVFFAATGLFLLPWGLYTLGKTGRFAILPPNGGITFLQGNNPDAAGSYTLIPGTSNSILYQAEEMRAIASRALGRPVDLYEADDFFRAGGLTYIRQMPADWLRVLAGKALYFVRPTETPVTADLAMERALDVGWLRAFAVGWWLVFPLALVGLADLAVFRRRVLGRAWPVVAAAGLLTLVLFVFYVSSRYRLLVAVPLCLVAGHGAVSLAAWQRENRRVALGAGLVVCSVWLAWALVNPVTLHPEARFARAWALSATGRTQEAGQAFESLARDHPDSLRYQRAYRSFLESARSKEPPGPDESRP